MFMFILYYLINLSSVMQVLNLKTLLTTCEAQLNDSAPWRMHTNILGTVVTLAPDIITANLPRVCFAMFSTQLKIQL